MSGPPIFKPHQPIKKKKSADYHRFFNLWMSLEIGGKNRLVGIRPYPYNMLRITSDTGHTVLGSYSTENCVRVGQSSRIQREKIRQITQTQPSRIQHEVSRWVRWGSPTLRVERFKYWSRKRQLERVSSPKPQNSSWPGIYPSRGGEPLW